MAVNLPMLGAEMVAETTKGLPSHVIARAVIEASNGQSFSPEAIMAASRNHPDQPEAALQRSMVALQAHYDSFLRVAEWTGMRSPSGRRSTVGTRWDLP